MNAEELRETIQEILDGYELADDVRKALEELLRELERPHPKELFWARVLAEFIERLGGRMPPVIREFIELYGAALKSGIGWATYLGCIKYWLLRQQGASHDDAVETLKMTEGAEWCRFLWTMHHLPEVEEDPGGDAVDGGLLDGPLDEEEWRPPPPSPPDDGVLWHEDDAECCEDEGGRDEPVVVDWGTLHVVPPSPDPGEQPGQHPPQLEGSCSVRHRCGILYASVEVLIGYTMPYFAATPAADAGNVLEVEKTDTKWTFTFTRFPLHMTESSLLELRAVSRCFTTIEAGQGERAV